MALEHSSSKLKSTLAAVLFAGGMTATMPADGHIPTPHPIEKTDQTPKSKLFTIDEFVSPVEGSVKERRELAENLFRLVMEKGNEKEDGSKEMLFPLHLSSENVTIRVISFPESSPHKTNELRIVVFRMNDNDSTPIFLADTEITGTPSMFQLPIEEKGNPWPQTYLTVGEHPLANRVYLGLLHQILDGN